MKSTLIALTLAAAASLGALTGCMVGELGPEDGDEAAATATTSGGTTFTGTATSCLLVKAQASNLDGWCLTFAQANQPEKNWTSCKATNLSYKTTPFGACAYSYQCSCTYLLDPGGPKTTTPSPTGPGPNS